MRLGQLARKLSVRQHELVQYLASQQITVAENSNTRLESGYVEILVGKFAPNSSVEEVATYSEEKDEEIITLETPSEIPGEVSIEQPIDSEISLIAETISEDKAEVIKAPKVELQGLKVLGKIDLPSPKKKAESIADSEINPTTVPQEPSRRKINTDERKTPRREVQNRPVKNSIAAAREKEAEERRLKHEEHSELAKEQRTKNYYKKVKVSAPTRRAKLVEEQVEEISSGEVAESPKGFWGKIRHWFKT